MTAIDRIAELEARVSWLESELAISISLEQIDALRQRLKVTGSQAYVLLALHNPNRRALSFGQISERVPEKQGRNDEVCRAIVRAWVFKIRQRLGQDVIETIEHGYRIGPRGAALVSWALSVRQAAA